MLHKEGVLHKGRIGVEDPRSSAVVMTFLHGVLDLRNITLEERFLKGGNILLR